MGRKHCGKTRNCSLRAISLFPTVFSKGLYCRYVKTRACLGKGLKCPFCTQTIFYPVTFSRRSVQFKPEYSNWVQFALLYLSNIIHGCLMSFVSIWGQKVTGSENCWYVKLLRQNSFLFSTLKLNDQMMVIWEGNPRIRKIILRRTGKILQENKDRHSGLFIITKKNLSRMALTLSLIYHFENVPNSKKLQTTSEMWLLRILRYRLHRKHCGKRWNCSFWAISPFSTMFF